MLAAVVVIIVVIVIVMTVVAVIVASVFTLVIIAALVVGGASNPFSFFGIGVPICCLYQFADGCGPLAVQLLTELLVLEPFGEGGDGHGVGDAGNGVACL